MIRVINRVMKKVNLIIGLASENHYKPYHFFIA